MTRLDHQIEEMVGHYRDTVKHSEGCIEDFQRMKKARDLAAKARQKVLPLIERLEEIREMDTEAQQLQAINELRPEMRCIERLSSNATSLAEELEDAAA